MNQAEKKKKNPNHITVWKLSGSCLRENNNSNGNRKKGTNRINELWEAKLTKISNFHKLFNTKEGQEFENRRIPT